jgi:hypothetical protein
MSFTTIPKTIVDQTLKLARAPLDVALRPFGGSASSAGQFVDRAEAGARSAAGTILADNELKEKGRASMLATSERERAARLRESAEVRQHEADQRQARIAEEARRAKAAAAEKEDRDRRNAEQRKKDRQSAARKTATKKKQKVAKTTAEKARANKKADNSAQLKKLKAKEKDIKAKEDAAAAEREAERLEKAAAAAKAARKKDQ